MTQAAVMIGGIAYAARPAAAGPVPAELAATARQVVTWRAPGGHGGIAGWIAVDDGSLRTRPRAGGGGFVCFTGGCDPAGGPLRYEADVPDPARGVAVIGRAHRRWLAAQ